ncbi:hypothetical protein V5O48_018030 [Marasmius crinis-equi]|uniref:Uncharacterized protein n=1 Tax=Marasmius crinis-equi TaxID=585013 RepID=A0ABR3EMA8_9AGAR
MAEPASESYEEAFPPLPESATTRDPPPDTSGNANSDAEDNKDQTLTPPIDKGKEKQREVTPVHSEATEPPESIDGDGNIPAGRDDDINDPYLQAELHTAMWVSREESERATSTIPYTGPSKHPQTSSTASIHHIYEDPKAPQKRKPAHQTVEDHSVISPTPILCHVTN